MEVNEYTPCIVRLSDGTYYRRMPKNCWTRASEGSNATVFISGDHAAREVQALGLTGFTLMFSVDGCGQLRDCI